MTEELEKEMSTVCNLGEGIARRNLNKGISQGIPQGENKLGILMNKMREAGRVDDAFRAATDPVYREEMYTAFNITQGPVVPAT